MQTKIDPAKAEAPELIRVLAEKPCSCLSSNFSSGCCGACYAEDRHSHACNRCEDGLANSWASEPCPKMQTVFHPDTCGCVNDRVPKAVRLEVLFEHGITSVKEDFEPRNSREGYLATHGWSLLNPPQGRGETPLLAALRAVVRSQMSDE